MKKKLWLIVLAVLVFAAIVAAVLLLKPAEQPTEPQNSELPEVELVSTDDAQETKPEKNAEQPDSNTEAEKTSESEQNTEPETTIEPEQEQTQTPVEIPPDFDPTSGKLPWEGKEYELPEIDIA